MKKKFNIIDILIIAVIILAIAAVVYLKSTGGISTETDAGSRIAVLEVVEKEAGFAEQIKIGENVTETVKKASIGTIEAVETKPAVRNTYDKITGEAKTVTIPEREDVYITMRVKADAEVAVGKALGIITKQFTARGYVVEIEDVEEDA